MLTEQKGKIEIPILKNLTRPEIRAAFEVLGEKPFRADQIFEWMYRHGAQNFAEMTNLAKSLRTRLDESASLMTLSIEKTLLSAHDGTRKYLFRTADGNLIESVYMQYTFGSSLCVSSQAGCRMGCIFCASGLNGLARNLTSGEMSDQFLLARRDTGEDIRHIVVMGTGEPMDNYDNVMKFLANITDYAGIGLGRRQLTVSTCGLMPGMERFLKDMPQANLAISLHAPNDEIRTRIMPTAATHKVQDILSFARRYVADTGRKLTFEYVLIKGLNDLPIHADELAQKLRGLHCLVNLIPLNHVAEASLVPSDHSTIRAFKDRLETKGIGATVRRELGSDIAAACGQLRLENLSSF
jgi:23S rRNA (adenine2503-C2)-methyltransferase